ncbi:MAG: hypothetical protein ACREQA_09200 [Candidatus Binatia bacterium]
MSSIGVVVLSLQGMKHLAQCLESIQWADVVALMHVGEGEPVIGANLPLPAILRKVSGSEGARKLSQEIQTDWVLHLWGEERVGAHLRDELLALCKRELTPLPRGYRIPIRSLLLGRWIEGSLWGPSPSLRLSRKVEELSLGWWNTTERGDQESPGLLRGWIEDYSSTELSEGVGRVEAISSLWAEQLQARGRSLRPSAMAVCSLRVFMRVLFMNGAFSNGFAGLTLSTLAGYAALLSGAKVWEARNVRDKTKGER